MNIRTLILDDDKNSRLAAAAALAEYPEIEIVGSFSESSEMLEFLENNSAQLLFLDIELHEETGFRIAQMLCRDYPDIMIVFLTGHSSYAIDGYDFHPVNFLTKPIHAFKLEQTIKEVRRRMEHDEGQKSAKLMFRLQRGYRILDVCDICYIERLHRKNYLHTENDVLCIAGYTMYELEEMLSEHGFFLCHQSVLISLYRVASVRDSGRQRYEVLLQGCEAPMPVSRYHYDELLSQLKHIGIQTF